MLPVKTKGKILKIVSHLMSALFFLATVTSVTIFVVFSCSWIMDLVSGHNTFPCVHQYMCGLHMLLELKGIKIITV
jgi:hypothetical protein